jgi:hypothetical protein
MNITNLPEPATPADYDEAITRYAGLVQARAFSVYRLGTIRTSGITPAEVLVVVDRQGIDNRYFFSALERLPRRLVPVFLHEPYILPAWSLAVMQYTEHFAPALLAGREVLRAYTPLEDPSDRWCRLLEGYCGASAFYAQSVESGALSGRAMMAAAETMARLLRDAALVFGRTVAEDVSARLEGVAAAFFRRRDSEATVKDAWELFRQAVSVLDVQLCSALHLSPADSVVQAAQEILQGDREIDGLEREYAFLRARTIDGYHKDLASLGFPYGNLFPNAAYPRAARALTAAPLMSRVVRSFYHVRRRFDEYAHA